MDPDTSCSHKLLSKHFPKSNKEHRWLADRKENYPDGYLEEWSLSSDSTIYENGKPSDFLPDQSKYEITDTFQLSYDPLFNLSYSIVPKHKRHPPITQDNQNNQNNKMLESSQTKIINSGLDDLSTHTEKNTDKYRNDYLVKMSTGASTNISHHAHIPKSKNLNKLPRKNFDQGPKKNLLTEIQTKSVSPEPKIKRPLATDKKQVLETLPKQTNSVQVEEPNILLPNNTPVNNTPVNDISIDNKRVDQTGTNEIYTGNLPSEPKGDVFHAVSIILSTHDNLVLNKENGYEIKFSTGMLEGTGISINETGNTITFNEDGSYRFEICGDAALFSDVNVNLVYDSDKFPPDIKEFSFVKIPKDEGKLQLRGIPTILPLQKNQTIIPKLVPTPDESIVLIGGTRLLVHRVA